MPTIPAQDDSRAPRLLITRPQTAAQRFVEALGPWPGEIIISPLLEIVPVATPPPTPPPNALIFTSKNAVTCYQGPLSLPAYCIGSATTAAARARGLSAERVGADAAELISGLPAYQPNQPLVHVRGMHVAQPVAASLTEAGLRCAEWIVYDQVARPLSPGARQALFAGSTDADTSLIIPLFSPRSAELLGASLTKVTASPAWRFVAISPNVADRIANLVPNTPILTAERPDAEAMVAAVHASASHVRALEGRAPLP